MIERYADLAGRLRVAIRIAGADEQRAIDLVVECLEHNDRRLIAERDAWCTIARELLNVAGLPAEVDFPPLEIVELRETKNLPRRLVAQLEQFYADLTRKHEARRRRDPFPGHTTDQRQLLVDLFAELEDGRARIATHMREVTEQGDTELTITFRQLGARQPGSRRWER